jgi:hypothetical protein
MKKIFALNIFVALLSVIPGCIAIPTGEKILGETVVGERKAQDGQVSEQILKVKGLRDYYVLIGPDGCGTSGHISFYRFYMKKGENKIYLSHVNFSPADDVIGYPFLPVQGSTKWIGARSVHVEEKKVDMELIVFDENRIYRTLVMKQCAYTGVPQEINYYGMTFEDGNTKITFHKNNGEYLFDVIKNTFEKK